MAIVKDTDGSTEDKITLEINNGDYQALKAVKDKFKLTDDEAVLRFALAVLTQSKTDTLYIDDGTGVKVGLQPSESLRSKPDGTETPTK